MKCIVFLPSFLFKVLFYLKAFFSLDDKSIKITMYNFKNCTDFVLYKKKKKFKFSSISKFLLLVNSKLIKLEKLNLS